MIDSVSLDNDNQILSQYDTIEKDLRIKNLSKINIFIGGNNSGKSRFLRTLFSEDNIKYTSKEVDIREFNQLIQDLKSEVNKFLERIENPEYLRQRYLDDLREIEYLSIALNFNTSVRQFIYDIANFRGRLVSKYSDNESAMVNLFAQIGEKYLTQFDELVKETVYDFKLKNIYIPTLRGLRNISGVNNDIFLNCTIKDYFSESHISGNIKFSIYTGLSLYEDTKKLLLGDKKDRAKVNAFANFLKEAFFNNQDVELIPREGKDVVYLTIGKNEEHPIYDLGDGIQSIIILTYPLFFRQGEKINFFIEEPEQYLHPGFQRTYIETLLKFNDYQYFITTHSNHLLDLTLDKDHISVYTFKKGDEKNNIPQFIIENVENEDSNILENIGVRNSSVFLSNCAIWVEGITDRIYIRKYLDIYQLSKHLKFKEDLHYSFVEYGGNNITHWSFLDNTDHKHRNIEVDRLCGKLFLISDNDGVDLDSKSNAKAERQLKLKKKLGDRYYCLKSREIENSLSPLVLKNTIRDIEMGNNKIDFRVGFADEIDYQDTKIGDFINMNTINRKKSYADKSGTIKEKLNFAKRATQFIKEEGDLTRDAFNLTVLLYEFIKSNN